MEMAGNCWKMSKMNGNEWKLLELAVTGRKLMKLDRVGPVEKRRRRKNICDTQHVTSDT